MNSESDQISKSDALGALQRSGYLLESRLESLLRQNEFVVETNSLIPDDITDKSREVDIWASCTRCYDFGPEKQGELFLELVIECVNPPQPVAFITKEHTDPLFERKDFWDAMKLVGNPQDSEVSPHNTWNWLNRSLSLPRFHHYRSGRVSTQYCSFSKKRGTGEWMAHHRDEDHETIRKLCLATDHYVRDCIVPDFVRTGPWALTMIYPVLVVGSELYEIRPTKRSARVLKASHINYRCAQAIRGDEQDYHIDVVTENGFQLYLNMVMREFERLKGHLHRKHQELSDLWATRQQNHLRLTRSGGGAAQ
jgi:hypothetical protein